MGKKKVTEVRCVVRVKFQDGTDQYVYRYRGDVIEDGNYVLVPDRRGKNGFKVSLAMVTEVLDWDVNASVAVIQKVDLSDYLDRDMLMAKRNALLAEAEERAALVRSRTKLEKDVEDDVVGSELLAEIQKIDKKLGL